MQYNDLMKKKRIVLNDKDKIASVIKELDEKKNEALRNAWKKVNKVSGLFNSLNSVQCNFFTLHWNNWNSYTTLFYLVEKRSSRLYKNAYKGTYSSNQK